MRNTPIVRTCALVGVVAASGIAAEPRDAAAGQFRVATCQADTYNFSTDAFTDGPLHLGMRIRRACNPAGPGWRGLITATVKGKGAVPRYSTAAITMTAPPNTSFKTFRWAGEIRRSDCRFEMQLLADGNGTSFPMERRPANKLCPGRVTFTRSATAKSQLWEIPGATRIIQSIVCLGPPIKRSCSLRGENYIRTSQAEVEIADDEVPTATILTGTPLADGKWVGGVSQPLKYEASDNVGVRRVKSVAGKQSGGSKERPCALVTESSFALTVPCPSGSDEMTVDTTRLESGPHGLVLQATDTADNIGSSAPVPVRIDNKAPSQVTVSVDGGEEWRSSKDFTVRWTDPPEEPQGAPIAAAIYSMCPQDEGICTRSDGEATGIASLGVQAPAPGEWMLRLWRRDEVGNESESQASAPVTLRYDPDAPQLGFEDSPEADPTSVSVLVTDRLAGLADGSIEISRQGSDTWHALPTQKDGSRLLARIDDAALAAGEYVLRARARDRAHNEGSTDRRLDGQPMSLELPLRAAATMQAGVVRKRKIRTGRKTRRAVTELEPATRLAFGASARIAGRLADAAGAGIGSAAVQVYSRAVGSAEQLVAELQTDADGRYEYKVIGSASRTLRFVHGGSTALLPSQDEVTLAVPASSTLRVDRRSVLTWELVQFSGRLRGRPPPPGGKLVELQARMPGYWHTFSTTSTDDAGRWVIPYRFRRVKGVAQIRLRVRLRREAGYPFETGRSPSRLVQVRGGT